MARREWSEPSTPTTIPGISAPQIPDPLRLTLITAWPDDPAEGGRRVPGARTQGPSRAGGGCLSAHREYQRYAPRTHVRCTAAHRNDSHPQAPTTPGGLGSGLN